MTNETQPTYVLGPTVRQGTAPSGVTNFIYAVLAR